MAKIIKAKAKSNFDKLLDRYLDLEEDDQIGGTSNNRHKMYRLVVKMVDAADNLEDALEVLAILTPRSKYYKSAFDKAHGFTETFEDSDRLLACYDNRDDDYYIVLQETYERADTSEDWAQIYGLLDEIIDDLMNERGRAYESNLPLDKLDNLSDKLENQLRDAFQHILNLSNTIEELDGVILLLTPSSDWDDMEETIKKRDLLIKKQ